MKNFNLRIKVSFVLAALIAILSICSVFAVTYLQDGYWKFEVPTSETDVYYVAGYTGDSSMIQIPALFLQKPVVKINNNTFLNNTKMTLVDIPATIKTIGMNAFYGCASLESVTIPTAVSEIGNNAFYGCASLASVSFRNDSELEVVPMNCFSGCSFLTAVELPVGLTTISAKAFLGCTELQQITIYPYVTSIDSTAFKNCESLTIYGYDDTYAQQFASDNNIPFVSLGSYEYPTEPSEPETSENTQPTETEPATETTPSDTNPTESDPTESTSKFPEGTVYLIGDTDLSGNVTVKDATLIQKHAADLVKLDKIQLFLANCNNEGDVNVKDATHIQKYCAGFKNILFVGTEVVI